MKRVLKKYFIPHEGNNHRPHLLRREATLIIASVVIALELVFLIEALVIFPHSNFLAAIIPGVLVTETNQNRQANNLTSLAVSSVLQQAAELKAEDMAAKGYFAHTSPDGKTPWYWLGQVGYSFSAAGENLAVNFFDSKDVADAWMNSSGHRANILNKNFTEIGIATARGAYEGHEAVFVVQFFGRPAYAAPITAPLSLAKPKPVSPKPVALTPLASSTTVAKTHQEMFIAVKGAETSAAPAEQATQQAQNSFFGTMLASAPKTSIDYLYFAIFAIVFIAVILNLFIRMRIQHPHLILHGILILFVIASMLLINDYLSVSSLQII